MSADALPWGLGPRALLLSVSGMLVLIGAAFVASRVLRSLRHGFSIRLQLFLAIAGTTTLLVGLFGLLAFDRLQARAAQLLAEGGSSVEAAAEILRDVGPKLAVVAVLLGMGAATAAVLLGRGVASPIERLTHAAEAIARGERHAVLPHPTGREVRRLTAAFESMRRALEERHAMEQFVADLSHELKNPVSAIRAACEVLITEGAAEDPEARTRFLRRIDDAGKRLELLLQDLLALARIEARGLPSDAEPVELDEVVRASVAGLAGRLEARGLSVDARLAPARVRGSERWLRRAIDNLLANAIRFGPTGSALEVRLRVDDGTAVLTVRDHGPGVAPALRPRLFERFVSDRADADGTGLGLAIVRAVAEHHGGAARLVDGVSPGACFELSVPLA